MRRVERSARPVLNRPKSASADDGLETQRVGSHPRKPSRSYHDLGEISLEIVPAPDETFEATLRRFKRTVAQSGILREAKRREHHMSTRDKKRMKSAEAAKKRRRRQ